MLIKNWVREKIRYISFLALNYFFAMLQSTVNIVFFNQKSGQFGTQSGIWTEYSRGYFFKKFLGVTGTLQWEVAGRITVFKKKPPF